MHNFGLAMDHHGHILNNNKATGSTKVSRYLPGLRDTILNTKQKTKTQVHNANVLVVFVGRAIIVVPPRADYFPTDAG